jgi:hypothetical protein
MAITECDRIPRGLRLSPLPNTDYVRLTERLAAPAARYRSAASDVPHSRLADERGHSRSGYRIRQGLPLDVRLADALELGAIG